MAANERKVVAKAPSIVNESAGRCIAEPPKSAMTTHAITLLCGGILLLGGCSDGTSSTDCGKVQPCGGDVVGHWKFVEDCEGAKVRAELADNFAMSVAQSWCPAQTLQGDHPMVSGSLVFDAGGTYAIAATVGGILDINIPASCLSGTTCAAVAAANQAQIAAGTYANPNATAVSCSGSADCSCHETLAAPQNEAGTYAVSGSVVTLTATDGTVSHLTVCVEGNDLHILGTSMSATGQTEVDADSIAVRQ